VGAAKEVFNSIGMEGAEGQSTIWVYLLRIFLLVGLLLHPFKLTEKKFTCIFYLGLDTEFLALRNVSLHEFGEDGMVDGKPLDRVQMLHQLQAHGTTHPSVSTLASDLT
jgi:hypothetical protein